MTDVEKRLDAQARAIRDLRRDVAALKAALADTPERSESRIAETVTQSTSEPAGTPGVFVPVPTCYACGKPKAEGRSLILCHDCGSARSRAMTHGNTVPRYSSCGNCGKHLNGATMPICGKCRIAYRKWRDKMVSGNRSR